MEDQSQDHFSLSDSASHHETVDEENSQVSNDPSLHTPSRHLLGPSDEGVTQAIAPLSDVTPEQPHYTSQEADALYRSQLPPRASRRHRRMQQEGTHEAHNEAPVPVSPPEASAQQREKAALEETQAFSPIDIEDARRDDTNDIPAPTLRHSVMPSEGPREDQPITQTVAFPPLTQAQASDGALSDYQSSLPYPSADHAFPATQQGYHLSRAGGEDQSRARMHTKLIVTILLLIALIVILVGVCVWYALAGNHTQQQVPPQQTPTTQPVPSDTYNSDEQPQDSLQPVQTQPPSPSPSSAPSPAQSHAPAQSPPAHQQRPAPSSAPASSAPAPKPSPHTTAPKKPEPPQASHSSQPSAPPHKVHE